MTSFVTLTASKTATHAGLTEDAALAFRIMAYTVIRREQVVHVQQDRYAVETLGYTLGGLTDDELAIMEAGLFTLGKFDRSGDERAISLTEKGHALAARLVKYETAIRERGMETKDLARWMRATSEKFTAPVTRCGI